MLGHELEVGEGDKKFVQNYDDENSWKTLIWEIEKKMWE
jgi:hypothetical protein